MLLVPWHASPSAAYAAAAAVGPWRPLAHGASGPWDEVIILALFLAIVGAIWVFVHTSKPEDTDEPPQVPGDAPEG